MRIATLNIRHGGGKRVGLIAAFIKDLKPDCLLLTEYRFNPSGLDLSIALYELGYKYQSPISGDAKENQLRWFSQLPITEPRIPNSSQFSVEQRISVIKVGGISLVGVYFPQGKLKAPVFDYLTATFLANEMEAAILIGDFNTGKHWADEETNTFLCSDRFEQLLQSGWIDAWRLRNPDAREFSWYSNKGNGFRIDHALCTKVINEALIGVSYLRESIGSISDHACLLLDIAN